MQEVEVRAKNWTKLTEDIVHFAYCASTAFKDGDVQTQREILNSLGWNHRIESRKLFVDLYSWFSVLKKGEKELMPRIEALEPDKTLDPQRRMEAFASIRPSLCRGPGSNRRPHPLQGYALPTELPRR